MTNQPQDYDSINPFDNNSNAFSENFDLDENPSENFDLDHNPSENFNPNFTHKFSCDLPILSPILPSIVVGEVISVPGMDEFLNIVYNHEYLSLYPSLVSNEMEETNIESHHELTLYGFSSFGSRMHDKKFQDYLITNKSIKNNSQDIINGIFLYTDEDIEMVKYIRENLEALNILTGKWCAIYVLEEPSPSFESLKKYWKSILHAKLYKEWSLFRWISKTKPFDRNECYKIAEEFGIPSEQFPCLVLLPPLTEISSQEKLIVPIKEVSKEYFRHLFSTLEKIVNGSKEINKYEAIKINFKKIVNYLEENSQRISKQTERKFEFNGTTIIVNTLEELKMTENNPTFNIDKSNIGSVTGTGKIDTAIVEQHNYSPEQKQNLAEAAKEIQDLLDQLSKTYSPANPTNNAKIATATLEAIEKNPTLKSRVINALKVGGTEAIKELLDHPAVNILMASIEGFSSAE